MWARLLALLSDEGGWIRRPLGTVLVAVAVGTTGTAIIIRHVEDGGAPPGTANLWVDTNGGTCTRQGTPAEYVDAAACSSYSAAYSASSSSDTIRIKNGTYSAQSIGSGTKTVSFLGESQAGVMFPSISISASNVTVDNTSATAVTGSSRNYSVDGDHVTISNFSGSTGVGLSSSADFTTLLHGNIGPQDSCDWGNPPGGDGEDAIRVGEFVSGGEATDVVIDDVTIHDLTGFSGCSEHQDAVQGAGCIRLTIRNSHFYNTGTSHVGCKDNIVNTITIENNEFGNPTNDAGGGGNSFFIYCNVSGSGGTILIQNNTFYTSQPTINNTSGESPACTTITSRNNYTVNGGGVCGANTVTRNVFGSGACGSNTKTCTPTWAAGGSPTNANADVASSDTCTKNVVPIDPVTYPATDIHGNPRPAVGNETGVTAAANEVG